MGVSLETVHSHVQEAIIEQVHLLAPTSIPSLCLVSRRIRNVALPVFYRDVTFRFGCNPPKKDQKQWDRTCTTHEAKENCLRVLDTQSAPSKLKSEALTKWRLELHSRNNDPMQRICSWLRGPFTDVILKSVRSITVQISCQNPVSSEEYQCLDDALVVQFIKQLSRLEHVIFQKIVGQIPLIILQTLETHHPQTKLEVLELPCCYPVPADPIELSLATSSMLDTITFTRNIYGNDFFARQRYSRILCLSPNLKRIRMSTRMGSYGCCPAPDAMDAWDLAVWKKSSAQDIDPTQTVDAWYAWHEKYHNEQSVLKAVTELSLRDVLFDSDRYSRYWSSFIDFSKLVILDLRGCYLKSGILTGTMARDTLINLQYLGLSINFSEDFHAASTFLYECRPLKGLDLTNQGIPLDSFLSNHASTLQSLILRPEEDHSRACLPYRQGYTGYGNPVQADSIHRDIHKDLSYIRDTCSHLKELGISLVRTEDGKQEEQCKEILSTFSELRSLILLYPDEKVFDNALPMWLRDRHTSDEIEKSEHLKKMFGMVDADYAAKLWTELSLRKSGKSLERLLVQTGDRFHNPSMANHTGCPGPQVYIVDEGERDDGADGPRVIHKHATEVDRIHLTPSMPRFSMFM